MQPVAINFLGPFGSTSGSRGGLRGIKSSEGDEGNTIPQYDVPLARESATGREPCRKRTGDPPKEEKKEREKEKKKNTSKSRSMGEPLGNKSLMATWVNLGTSGSWNQDVRDRRWHNQDARALPGTEDPRRVVDPRRIPAERTTRAEV